MVIDPRTLQEISDVADCHLIPKCFGVSEKTVPLDRDFDNKIGENCDWQLKAYISIWYGDVLEGRLAVIGGSKTLTARLMVSQQRFEVSKPGGGTLEDFQRRALAVQDGRTPVEGFCTRGVDGAKAFASMINSAFLVLYHQGRRDFSGAAFDQARGILRKAINDELTATDWESIQDIATMYFVFDQAKVAPGSQVTHNDWRRLYDPNLDVKDGVLDDFPAKCVSEEGGSLVVTLPYSRSLRGKVAFPLGKVGA